MTKRETKTVVVASVALLIFLAMFYERLHDMIADPFLRSAFNIVTNTAEIVSVMLWCVSVKNRIINKQICRYLICVGALMCFWLFIRAIKWYFVGKFDDVTRYLWYMFYIPMILIPLFGVFIASSIGKPENYRLPGKWKLLFIPAFVLIILILTNDFHRLAFDFPNGIYYFNHDYTYNIVFYLNFAWFTILGAIFIITMLVKCRVPGRRAFQKMPAIVFICATVFWIVYYLGFRGCDLVAMDCLMITLLLESSIQSGLIRSNQKYNELFEKTSIAVRIIDNEYNTCFASANAKSFSKLVMMKAVKKPVDKGSSRISSSPISGGYVLWQEDVSKIKELMYKLRETQEQLNENNELLRAENELKEKKAKIDEKNRLYDRITREVAVQLKKAEGLIQQAERNSAEAEGIFAELCVLNAYIKRRGNLLLLNEDYYFINSKELEYCITESLDNIRINDVYVALNGSCECNMSVESAVLMYDLFEKAVEQLLHSMTACCVYLSCNESKISLRIQIGCETAIDEKMLNCIRNSALVRNIYVEDEDATIDIEAARMVNADV